MPDRDGWRVNGWVKKGILLGFRLGAIVDLSIDRSRQPFFDKATYPVKRLDGREGFALSPADPVFATAVSLEKA